VRNAASQPLPGLALIEVGELHGHVWGAGALVDQRGEFRVELPKEGQYGLTPDISETMLDRARGAGLGSKLG
jgi:hypothetical protein